MARGLAEQTAAADAFQRPLVPRSRFQARLSGGVRLQKSVENLCPSREVHMERRLSAILAADIAGYSRLMGEDEDGTVQALKGHQEEVLPLVAKFGGRIIDTAGDGILAEFPSVIAAVECATDIQVTMARRNAEVPENRRMLFRIGINLGDLIHDGARIYGDGINVAARLEGIAEPGGICISRQVFEQVDRALDMVFNALGPRNLKNIARPVDVY